MRRDDVNELALAILVVVVALLLVDCIWLHIKCARQGKDVSALTERVEALARLRSDGAEKIPSFTDKAKQAYEKVKSAAAKGFEAAKEEYSK